MKILLEPRSLLVLQGPKSSQAEIFGFCQVKHGETTDFTPDSYEYELYEASIFEGSNLGHPDLIDIHDIQIQVPSVLSGV